MTSEAHDVLLVLGGLSVLAAGWAFWLAYRAGLPELIAELLAVRIVRVDRRPIPEADPVPALDDPWRRDMTRTLSLDTLPQMQIAELERQRAHVLQFDRRRLLDDGVVGVTLSRKVH